MPIYRSFTIADGQGLDWADMDNAGRWLRSQIFDTMGAFARIAEADVDPPLTYAFCFGNSCAPYANATGLTLKNLAGPIAQKITAGVDGNDPHFVVYYAASDELNTTLAAADPTNPRIDLIAVKIEDALGAGVARHFEDAISGAKTSQSLPPYRYVKITKTVVQGTPNATPVEPTPPSGYVKWCAVLVPATATNLLQANVRDHRMPVGLGAREVYARDWQKLESEWTVYNLGGLVGFRDNVASVVHARALCPGLEYSGRIVKIGLVSEIPSGGPACELIRDDLFLESAGEASVTVLETVTSTLLATPAGTPDRYYKEVAPTLPLWLNGYAAGYANRVTPPIHSQGGQNYTRAGIRVSGSGSADSVRIFLARFVVAGG